MSIYIRRNTLTQAVINERRINNTNSILYHFQGDIQRRVEAKLQTAFQKPGYIHIHNLDVTIPSKEKINEFIESGFLKCKIFRKTFETLDMNESVTDKSMATYLSVLKTFDDDFWKGILVKMDIKCVSEITTELVIKYTYNQNFLGKKDRRIGRLNSTVLKRWVFFIRATI